MRARRVALRVMLAAAFAAAELVVPATTAGAGGVVIFDGDFCVVHDTDASDVFALFTLPAGNDGDYTGVFAKGPTGAVQGTGNVVGGMGKIDFRITQRGPYSGLTITGPKGPVGLGPLGAMLPFVVTAAPVVCDPSALKLPPVVAVTTTTTTRAPATTEEPATTEPEVTKPPSNSAASATTAGDSSLGWMWALLIGVGAVVLLAGIWVLVRSHLGVVADPCDEARRRWEQAQRDCEEARKRAAEKRKAADDARKTRDSAQKSLDDFRAQHPSAFAPDPDKVLGEDVETGRTVTRGDLASGRETADAIRHEYEQSPGPEAAHKASDAWRDADTPEAREARRKQQAANRAERDRLEKDLAAKRTAQTAADNDAKGAEGDANRVCAQAGALERAYRECLDAQQKAAGAPPKPPVPPVPPAPPVHAPVAPPVTPPTAAPQKLPVTTGSAPPPLVRPTTTPCTDGEVKPGTDRRTHAEFWLDDGDSPLTIEIPGAMAAHSMSLNDFVFDDFDPLLQADSSVLGARQFPLVITLRVRKHVLDCHKWDVCQSNQWFHMHDLSEELGERRTEQYSYNARVGRDELFLNEMKAEIRRAKAWAQRFSRDRDRYSDFVRGCNRDAQ